MGSRTINEWLLHISAKFNKHVWDTEVINNCAWRRPRKALWEIDTFMAKFNEIVSTYLLYLLEASDT